MTQEETLCRQVEEKIGAFLDGEVSPLEATGIESHLEHCASCRGISQTSKEISNLFRNEGPRVPAAPAWTSTQARLERSKPGDLLGAGRIAILAASLLVVVGATSLLLNRKDENRELVVSTDRTGSADSSIQMAGFGLPGLERFLSEHRAAEVEPPEIEESSLSFEPRIPDRLPGGFQLEKTYLIRDRCCAGVCFLFKDREDRHVVLVQQGPSHPFVWKGAHLVEQKIGKTPCRRVRLAQVEVTQIDPDGRNLTLVVASSFAASDELVRYLADH